MKELTNGQQWGHWVLNTENITLQYKPNGHWKYEIDLETIHNSANMLDWIFQIHGHQFQEQWPSDLMNDLITALDDIFNPQSNLCSFGSSKKLPAKFIIERITESLVS